MRFNDVVNAAVDAVRPQAGERGVRIEWEPVGATDDSLVGDFDRLQQVVWNLLSNAVKFTASGGRVDVHVDRLNGQLRLQVADTGRGIKPEFLPHVFDRFRQADSSSTRSHGGLGIGLTIVRHIIELHGGTAHAESPGETMGATFTITLPPALTEIDRAADRFPSAPAEISLEQAESVSLDGVSVLIVDDEADAREMMAHSLGRAGAQVCCAGSVAEAVACLNHGVPDLIVSDIAMPGEDGYDLVRQLRRAPDTQGVPAIAVTAYAREEDRNRAILAGFQRHLAKPVNPLELVIAVDQLTRPSSRRSRRTGEPATAPGHNGEHDHPLSQPATQSS
jgi:CheY-like chemotaxis protein